MSSCLGNRCWREGGLFREVSRHPGRKLKEEMEYGFIFPFIFLLLLFDCGLDVFNHGSTMLKSNILLK